MLFTRSTVGGILLPNYELLMHIAHSSVFSKLSKYHATKCVPKVSFLIYSCLKCSNELRNAQSFDREWQYLIEFPNDTSGIWGRRKKMHEETRHHQLYTLQVQITSCLPITYLGFFAQLLSVKHHLYAFYSCTYVYVLVFLHLCVCVLLLLLQLNCSSTAIQSPKFCHYGEHKLLEIPVDGIRHHKSFSNF